MTFPVDPAAPVPPDGETDDAIHLRDPRHRHLTLCEQPVSKLNVADLPDIPDPFPGCWACVHAAGLWQAGFAAGRAAEREAITREIGERVIPRLTLAVQEARAFDSGMAEDYIEDAMKRLARSVSPAPNREPDA